MALAERAGQSEALPDLARAGIRSIAELASSTDRLVEAGISPITLEALLAAPPPVDEVSDLAVAAEAVCPANVKRAVAELRDNMLAAPDLEPPGVRGQGPRLAHQYRAQDLGGDRRRLSLPGNSGDVEVTQPAAPRRTMCRMAACTGHSG